MPWSFPDQNACTAQKETELKVVIPQRALLDFIEEVLASNVTCVHGVPEIATK